MDERLVEVFWFWKQVVLVAAFRTVCAEKLLKIIFMSPFCGLRPKKMNELFQGSSRVSADDIEEKMIFRN